jgi:hypothetical protein
LDIYWTLSFCLSLSQSRFAGWRCLPGAIGVALGARSRRRGSSPRSERPGCFSPLARGAASAPIGSAVASRPSVLFLLCRYELTGCLFRTVRAFKWPERRRTALHSQGCDWLEIQCPPHNTAMLSPVSALPSSPPHGFLGSTTERHAGGRNMEPMGHRRSWYACCWQAGSSQRTSITLGGIVDRRGKGLLTGEGRGSYAPRHSILMGRPQGHSDLCLVTIAGDKGILT